METKTVFSSSAITAGSIPRTHETHIIRPSKITTALRIEFFGDSILRYGLAAILIWVGLLKFTTYESQNIIPLVSNSPLLSWAYNFFSVEGFSRILGVIEIALGGLIALRNYSPSAAKIGSFGAIFMFLITLSFLFSTPGVVQEGYSFLALSNTGQTLAKDLMLLAAAVWSAGEAWKAEILKDSTSYSHSSAEL